MEERECAELEDESVNMQNTKMVHVNKQNSNADCEVDFDPLIMQLQMKPEGRICIEYEDVSVNVNIQQVYMHNNFGYQQIEGKSAREGPRKQAQGVTVTQLNSGDTQHDRDAGIEMSKSEYCGHKAGEKHPFNMQIESKQNDKGIYFITKPRTEKGSEVEQSYYDQENEVRSNVGGACAHVKGE